MLGALSVLLTTGGKDMETLLKSQCTLKMMEQLNDREEQVGHNHIAHNLYLCLMFHPPADHGVLGRVTILTGVLGGEITTKDSAQKSHQQIVAETKGTIKSER